MNAKLAVMCIREGCEHPKPHGMMVVFCSLTCREAHLRIVHDAKKAESAARRSDESVASDATLSVPSPLASSVVAETRPLPRTRGECIGGDRPCRFVQCRYHILAETGGIKNWNTEWSCALDVADDGEKTTDEVGAIIGVTRQRVSQIEAEALKKIRARMPLVAQWLLDH